MKMRFFYPAAFDASSRSQLAQEAEHVPVRASGNRSQRIVALIPMRADSKRVPNKNIRLFDGKPLYFHIITTMLACPLIDEIVVDTNYPKIMEEIPRQFDRVTVIPRPESLCSDTVPMNDILLHDVQQVEADWYVQTHATNPLLRAETVTRAIRAIIASTEHDTLFSVSPVYARFWDSAGRPINHDPRILLRTQDLAPIFEENSNLYIFRGETLKRLRNRIGERPLMYSIPKEEAWDIDEEIDFRIAELLHSQRHAGSTDAR
jgi:CMP-N-acetylneuraminic acid synthetase